MSCRSDPRCVANLQRWKEAGGPGQWIEAQRGCWNHEDWLTLLDSLRESSFWPLDPVTIGQVLEEAGRHWANLQAWQAAGEAAQWVEEHNGSWNHDEWLALLEDLRASEFWPLDPQAVGQVLEQLKAEWLPCQ